MTGPVKMICAECGTRTPLVCRCGTRTPLDCRCPTPTPTPTDMCARCLRVIAQRVRARRAEADHG